MTAAVPDNVESSLPADRPEQLAREILDALGQRICLIDEDGRIRLHNRAWQEFLLPENCCFRHPGSGPVAARRPWSMPCWPPETARLVDLEMRQLLAGENQAFGMEYECTAREPHRWYEMSVSRLPGNGSAYLLVVHEDISERKRVEMALRESARRIKEIGAHLESVREEQGAIIAREMHDELGAMLTMLKLQLASMSTRQAIPADQRSLMSGLVTQVSDALKVVKRISSDLRPATLDTLGLVATIRWYADQFAISSGIATTVDLPEYVRLSEVSSIAVFRIIQESLTNIARHSGASEVEIALRKDSGMLSVEISDNGSGIERAALEQATAFGIMGMRERADYLGGTLSVVGQPSLGTRVVLRIPLDD
jgi:signal transduction histidine kinase